MAEQQHTDAQKRSFHGWRVVAFTLITLASLLGSVSASQLNGITVLHFHAPLAKAGLSAAQAADYPACDESRNDWLWYDPDAGIWVVCAYRPDLGGWGWIQKSGYTPPDCGPANDGQNWTDPGTGINYQCDGINCVWFPYSGAAPMAAVKPTASRSG